MAETILLDTVTWDLVLDANGNIAHAKEPYSLAQDAASAIKTFAGECYWDTTVGVPYMTQILAQSNPLALIKQLFEDAALTVPGVGAATCFIESVNDRGISGQIQVRAVANMQTSTAQFQTINPQTGA
jgi:hypothetical protein